ncbi:uncharacterized protein VP01_5205g1, partial [Puccinia sorghi]
MVPPPQKSWLNPTCSVSRPTAELVPTRASCSTSAHLAACTAQKKPARLVEELVPALYHQYLRMFQKSASQGLPPLHWYDFRVELMPEAVLQASRFILLSPVENVVLDTAWHVLTWNLAWCWCIKFSNGGEC